MFIIVVSRRPHIK